MSKLWPRMTTTIACGSSARSLGLFGKGPTAEGTSSFCIAFAAACAPG